MKISKAGIDLIAKWEGFRGNAYLDAVGVWTIGYGHTRGVKPGDTITKTKAKEWLLSEIERHVVKIFDYVKVDLTQGQFDALASFHYNLGPNILKGTKLLYSINQKDWVSASEQMKLYNRGGGRVLKGLVNRRNEEAKLFLDSSPKVTKTPAKTPSKTPVKTQEKKYVTVKKGDTLSQIAKDHRLTLSQIIKLNPDKKSNPNLIHPKEKIRIE